MRPRRVSVAWCVAVMLTGGPTAAQEPAENELADDVPAVDVIQKPDAHDEPVQPLPWDAMVLYDSGRDDTRRAFVSAEICGARPCVLTRDGAIRFHLPEKGRFEVALWIVRRGQLTRIDYFEKRSPKDYVMLERILQRRPNRKIWSLARRIENGEIDTMYVYGAYLQYEIDQGDPLILEVKDRDHPREQRTFYFRYHRAGFRLRFDIALLIPINALAVPKPKPAWKSRTVNAALTLALHRHKDPEADYSLFNKILLSVHPTVFLGILSRELEIKGKLPQDQTDVFVGAGLTYFDFLFLGWGANLVQSPHTSGPFFGVHIGKAIRFVGRINKSRPDRWDDYLEQERKREVRFPEINRE